MVEAHTQKKYENLQAMIHTEIKVRANRNAEQYAKTVSGLRLYNNKIGFIYKSDNRLTDLEWLFAVLRVKTICWEILERQGINPSLSHLMNDRTNFSENYAYIKYYKEEAKR